MGKQPAWNTDAFQNWPNWSSLPWTQVPHFLGKTINGLMRLLRIYRRTRVRHNETCWGQDASLLCMLEPQGEPRVRQSQAKAKEIRWISSRLPGDYPDTLAIWQFTNKWRLIRTRGVGFFFFPHWSHPIDVMQTQTQGSMHSSRQIQSQSS